MSYNKSIVKEGKYGEFLEKTANQKVVLLEFGVGFNTPGIIRIPFEQMTYQNKNWNLVRFNKEYTGTYLNIKDRTIEVNEEIKEMIEELLAEYNQTSEK